MRVEEWAAAVRRLVQGGLRLGARLKASPFTEVLGRCPLRSLSAVRDARSYSRFVSSHRRRGDSKLRRSSAPALGSGGRVSRNVKGSCLGGEGARVRVNLGWQSVARIRPSMALRQPGPEPHPGSAPAKTNRTDDSE